MSYSIFYRKIKGQYAIHKPQDTKGMALIIVVFAMMLFATLGWTLVTMQSGDFEVNLRNLDSEGALGLAEAGAHWVLNQLHQSASFKTDSANGYPTGYAQHSLSPGEYRVVCRSPEVGELGDAVIVSTGYVPTQAQYRGMRIAKLMVSFGSIDKALYAANLLDWSDLDKDDSRINGTVAAVNYEGNGIMPNNEVQDLAVPGSGQRQVLSEAGNYPQINMAYMEQEAHTIWAPARSAEITAIDTVGGKSEITVNADIFNANPQSQFNGQALRDTTLGSWKNGFFEDGIWKDRSWGVIETVLSANSVRLNIAVNWNKGDRVCLVPKISPTGFGWNNVNKTYNIRFDCNIPLTRYDAIRNFTPQGALGTWNYKDWGVIQSVSTTPNTTTITVQVDNSVNLNDPLKRWSPGEFLGQVKRFTGNNNNELWYIKGDMLFDLRGSNSNCNTSSFITEGDIALMGSGRLSMKAHNSRSANQTFPNIATQNGNIFSNGDDRNFDGLIYSGTGDVQIHDLNGVSIYGRNVTIDGEVNLTLNAKYVDMDGFFSNVSFLSWQEQ